MLSILAPLLGIIGSIIPNMMRFFERRQEIKYEIQLTQLKIDAALKQAQITVDVENIKGDVEEGKSLRDHDAYLVGDKFFDALRASVRPVITYTFFLLFIAVKVSAAYVMLSTGQDVPTMLRAVWDVETMALFSTIVAFWFGSRTLEKTTNRILQNNVVRTMPAPQVAAPVQANRPTQPAQKKR
jgi:hypothetical protein